MHAPIISRVETFCLKINMEGMMRMIGVVAIMVAAIPVAVNFNEYRESDTPKKGPKKAPIEDKPKAGRLVIDFMVCLNRLIAIIINVKPMMPVIMRICVAAKALYPSMPFLLSTRPMACPKAPPKANKRPFKGMFSLTLSCSGLWLKTAIEIPKKVRVTPKIA